MTTGSPSAAALPDVDSSPLRSPLHFLRVALFSVSAVLVLSAGAVGQPSWVREAATEPVTVDEQASQITLYESHAVEITPKGHAKTHVRTMRKILKPSRQFSGSMTEWTTADRTVEGLRGWILPRSGEARDLSDKEIVELGTTEIRGYYDESRLLVARFDGLSAGDVVAFEYDIDDREVWGVFQRYSFQVQQPVHNAEFSVTIPERWNLKTMGWNLDSVASTEEGRTHRWTARNLAYRPVEPLMPNWSFLDRQISITAFDPAGAALPHFPDWNSVAHWVNGISEVPAGATDPVRQQAEVVTAVAHGARAQIASIADFVRDQIRYVAVEIGNGRWEPRSCTSTLYDRYGDCKDKTTLMRGMLAALNIPSSIVLANSAHYIDRDLPTPFQFNHAIVAIPTSALDSTAGLDGVTAGNWVFFDPTSEVTPFGFLPVEIQGSLVLVAHDADSGLVRLPHSSPSSNHTMLRADVTIEEGTALKALVTIADCGIKGRYARHAVNATPVNEQIEDLTREFSQTLEQCVISDYATGEHRDTSWTTFTVRSTKAVKQSGNAIFLRPNIFPQRDLPIVMKPTRLYPVWFGGPRRTDIDITIHLASGWRLDDPVPPRTSSCEEVARLSYSVLPGAGGSVRLASRSEYTGELVEVEKYPSVRAFSRELKAYAGLLLTFHRH